MIRVVRGVLGGTCKGGWKWEDGMKCKDSLGTKGKIGAEEGASKDM